MNHGREMPKYSLLVAASPNTASLSAIDFDVGSNSPVMLLLLLI